ncbi:MAG: dienelactone hydrolase, partial [Calditrichaeota bacterium]
MERLLNLQIPGKHGRPIVLDVYFQADGRPKPVVVFSHGFKGFKDWGHWHLVAEAFAGRGFVFVKFNFSHNGTRPENLTEFVDLEAFGNNNFSIELDDLGAVMDYITGEEAPVPREERQPEQLYLIGHSRGGGITILKAREDKRVKKIATWASVSEFGKYWTEEVVKEWQEKGVVYVVNARTGQQMPLYRQLYEDFQRNRDRLDIPAAVKSLTIPFLIVHGTADEAVPYADAVE